MEFKKDKAYSFPEMMAYGFTKEESLILADCHLYLGENSFEASLAVSVDAFQEIIKKSDDKTGAFEKACAEWFASDKTELFLPDVFTEPVHCKLTGLQFYFVKTEDDEDDFGSEKVFYFSLEPQTT